LTAFALLVMTVPWAFTSLKGGMYVVVVGGKRPWFSDGQMVIGALEPEITTIKVDLEHTSVFHKGSDFGQLPV
jgi:hypothetical protein